MESGDRALASRKTTTDNAASAITTVVPANTTAEPAVADFVGPDLYLRTSGSTGTPKLTRMSHQKWLNNAQACVDRWRLTPEDRLAVPVQIFHSYGFGAAFLPGLLAGAAMDVGRALDQMPSPELAKLSNVIATPHIGGLTPPAIEGQSLETVRQVQAIVNGEIPGGAVNAERWTRRG